MVKVQKPINETETIVREVWNTANIESKTELTDTQIEAVNKLLTSSYIFASPLLRSHLVTFMTLQKSKDRKSMTEFVEALRSKLDDRINKVKGFNLMG
jgi:hypothetical protein